MEANRGHLLPSTQQFLHRLDVVGPKIIYYDNITWMAGDPDLSQIGQEFICWWSASNEFYILSAYTGSILMYI